MRIWPWADIAGAAEYIHDLHIHATCVRIPPRPITGGMCTASPPPSLCITAALALCLLLEVLHREVSGQCRNTVELADKCVHLARQPVACECIWH